MGIFGGTDPLILKAPLQIGPGLLAEVARALATGKPRSIGLDAPRAIEKMMPPPKLVGLEHIPPRAPFLLVANHFQARGTWIGWIAVAIAGAVASVREADTRDLHWAVTSEWRWFEMAGRWVPNPMTTQLFSRAATIWGLILIPAHPAEVAGRARAIRQIFACLGLRPEPLTARGPVAIFPEGTATVELGAAKPGSGALIHRASSLGVPLIPAGVYEEHGTLVIRFGPPFSIDVSPNSGAESVDTRAGRQVMTTIGRLLPPHLWGVYAEDMQMDNRR